MPLHTLSGNVGWSTLFGGKFDNYNCSACTGPFEGGHHRLHSSTIVWSRVKQGGNTAPPINRKLDYKFTEHQFSSVLSDSLQAHGLQHTGPLGPTPTPGVCSNSCPLSLCCHPTISSSVPLLLHLLFFSASGSFQMSQFFTPGG